MWSVRGRPRLANPGGVAPHGCLGLTRPAGVSTKRSVQAREKPGPSGPWLLLPPKSG